MFRKSKHIGKCPHCAEPLVAFELEAVEIDACAECGGAWLDTGELVRLGEMAGVEHGVLSDALGRAKEGKKGNRRCPRCAARLRSLHVTDASGGSPVEIDQCPRAHGQWYDLGEIERIVASSAGGEETEVAKFFRRLFEFRLNQRQTQKSD